MLMIHFEDNRFYKVTGQFSDEITIQEVEILGPDLRLKAIKDIAKEFIGSEPKTVVLTGTISNATFINQEVIKPWTFTSFAADLIKETMTSCFKHLPKEPILESITIDGTLLISNSPVFVSIGTQTFEENVNPQEVKQRLKKELLTTINIATDFRKKRLVEAMKEGGDVDLLFHLHNEFFKEHKTSRIFVDTRVHTEVSDRFLVRGYLEIAKILRCEPPERLVSEYVLLPSPREESEGMRRRSPLGSLS